MGCGSSAGQVGDSRETMFRLQKIVSSHQKQEPIAQGRLYLFGQTRTQRKIIECETKLSSVKIISNKTRIPCPNIVIEPLESMYEQSQETFSLNKYGLSLLPPFNRMLALYLQTNIVFMCGGRDYDHYNVKNEVFFYSVEDAKIMSEMGRGELSPRTVYRPKYSRNRFQKMASMGEKRYAHMGIYSSKMKSVLVFGGINEKDEFLATCESYNIIENAWKQLPEMSVQRAHALCFEHAGKVYVFGGRSSQVKLTKKIEVYSVQQNEWNILRFKIHRGIQHALVFSQAPNEVLIVGGATHSYACKTVIKVNLEQRSYVWDSELSRQYSHAKGVMTGEDIFVFGGEKDTCQILNKKKWKLGLFPHRKSVESEELQEFSFTQESLVVKAEQNYQKKQLESTSSDQAVFFGTDEYPCIFFLERSSGHFKKRAVPLALRLKKNMVVVELPKRVFMLLGGSDKQEKKLSRSCFLYDANSNTASQSLKMAEKKINFAAVCLQDYVYVFGGYNKQKHAGLVGCQKFSLKQQKWEEIKMLKKARYKTFAEVIGQRKIAVFGEEERNVAVREIDIYHTRKDYYETFTLRLEIPPTLAIVYAAAQPEKIILLRHDLENIFEEIEILETRLREQSKQAEKHSIILSSASQASQQHREAQLYNIPKQESIQKYEQDYQSSELHKNNVMAMKPRMIEIKPIKHETSSEKVRQQREDSSFEVEKIAEEIKVEEHRFDRKMKISDKQMPDEANFADDLYIGLDTRSFQANLSTFKLKRSISEKKESLASRKHSNIVEEHSKIIEEENALRQEKDRPKEVGKPVQGLAKQKYNVVKRRNQLYFFTQTEVLVHSIQTNDKIRHKIQCESDLKLTHIS